MGRGRRGAAADGEQEDLTIDGAALGRLVTDLGADNVQEICALFVRDAGEGVRAIRSALESGDADAAARPAHRLTSAGGFVGASAFSARCKAIELLARTGRLDEAQGQADLLLEELERTSRRLRVVMASQTV